MKPSKAFPQLGLPGLDLTLDYVPVEENGDTGGWSGSTLFRNALDVKQGGYEQDGEATYVGFFHASRHASHGFKFASDYASRVCYADAHEPYYRQTRLGYKGKYLGYSSFCCSSKDLSHGGHPMLITRTSDVQVFNDEIASKWKAEAMANPGSNGMEFSQAMVDWVIEELRYKAKVFHQTGMLSIYNGDVVKSDSAIPESLKQALQDGVAPLEQVLEVYKDYHPGTKETVLNLIHPSLFPLIYGRTRILTDKIVRLEDCLERCGEGIISVEAPDDETQDGAYSKNFQWLPCDVEWTGDGGNMRYVKNGCVLAIN